MSLFPWHKRQLENLRHQRREITEELTSTIEEFAPKLWADFESRRIIPPTASDGSTYTSQPGTPTSGGTIGTRKRKTSYGADSSIIQHPMSWLDEKLFGWSTKASRRSRNASDSAGTEDTTPSVSQPVTPGYRTESEDDTADYDEVVRRVEERLNQADGSADGTRPSVTRRLSRRNSARTKSQLNLTELVPTDGVSTAVAHSAQDGLGQRKPTSGTD